MGNSESSQESSSPMLYHTPYIRTTTDDQVQQMAAPIGKARNDAESGECIQPVEHGRSNNDSLMDIDVAPVVPALAQDHGEWSDDLDKGDQRGVRRDLSARDALPDTMEVDTAVPGACTSASSSEQNTEEQPIEDASDDDSDDENVPSFHKLHLVNRSRWSSEEDPVCIQDRAGIAEAIHKIKKSSLPEAKPNPEFKTTSKRSELSQQLRYCRQQHCDLQPMMPSKQLAAHRYKIVVMVSESTRAMSKKVVRSLMWYKGWRKSLTSTIHHIYCNSVMVEEEDHCMMFCGRVLRGTERVEELDLLGDQLIVLHCVPKTEAEKYRRTICHKIDDKARKALEEEDNEMDLVPPVEHEPSQLAGDRDSSQLDDTEHAAMIEQAQLPLE